MRGWLSFITLWYFYLIPGVFSQSTGDGVVICLLMMARNEETLLRRHLPSWLPLLNPSGCIVGQVDDRSSDGSHSAFLDGDVISFDIVPMEKRFVYHYKFNGLGPARSLLLSEAHHRFGDYATHYFIGDPDWRFDISPQETVKSVRREIRKAMVRNDLLMPFKIYDRNGASSRWLDWFMRARPNLSFKYRWHETLEVPDDEYSYVMLHSFTITETEGGSESYHKEESGGSGTVARFVREIGLFELDLRDYPDDTRVLYYLGVDHCAVLQLYKQAAIEAKGFENWRDNVNKDDYDTHWKAAVGYLRRRVWDLWADSAKHLEMSWAAAKWLGRSLHDLAPVVKRENHEEALRAFNRCIDIDKERIECRLQKARLLLDMGNITGSWLEAQDTLKLEIPERAFLHVPYHYTCSAFVVAAQTAIANNLKKEGTDMLTKAMSSCSSGIYDEAPDFLLQLSKKLDKLGISKPERSKKPQIMVGSPQGTPPDSPPPMVSSSNPNPPMANPMSGVVKGIKAARPSSSSRTQDVPVKSRVASETNTQSPPPPQPPQPPTITDMDAEFLQIANRWLELASASDSGTEKSTLIAKALLAFPSEETLARVAQVLHQPSSCAVTDSKSGIPYSNTGSQSDLKSKLRGAEVEVAALIQDLARSNTER